MMCRTIAFFFVFVVASGVIPAQSVSGSWYGRADVSGAGAASNYLTELIIKQKGDEVEGLFGYYFKDSYQSFFVRGTYDIASRQVSIKNLPMVNYASSAHTGIECPMHFRGTLLVAKTGSSLKGSFYSDSKYKYTCPELRVNLSRDENDSSHSLLSYGGGLTTRKFWASTDTSGPVAYVVTPESDALISEFGKRSNIYGKDIYITSDSVLLSFYDNGDIDDDTISVFLNKKPVLVRRGLSARALNIYIGLDSSIEVNELSMFADNLGTFPPNTALMVISDGDIRYEYYLSASLKQNASVRLRRRK